MKESRQVYEPKYLCGKFGDQLLRGEYFVVHRKQIRSKNATETETGLWRGMLDPANYEIKVLAKDPLERQIITVFHELYHEIDPKADEDTTQSAAETLYSSLNHRQLRFFEFIIHPQTALTRRVVSKPAGSPKVVPDGMTHTILQENAA